MNSQSRPHKSPSGKQRAGQVTLFHVFAICGALLGAAVGGIVGLRYGIIGSVLGFVFGVPLGYYVGFAGSALFLLGLCSVLYPRDPDLGIISILKSGLSKMKHRKNT